MEVLTRTCTDKSRANIETVPLSCRDPARVDSDEFLNKFQQFLSIKGLSVRQSETGKYTYSEDYLQEEQHGQPILPYVPC